MDQSFFSTLSTEDERGEEEIELEETTDPQTQNTIKKTPLPDDVYFYIDQSIAHIS